jgi:FkbM family methyltransferase
MIAAIIRRFQKRNELYGLVLRWRLTPLARRLHERASESVWKLRCGPQGIRLTQKTRELRFNACDAGVIWMMMPLLDTFAERLFFQPEHGKKIADCRPRNLARYRVSSTSDHVWLRDLPEAADFFTGYFQKGRPEEGAVAFDVGAYCGEMTIALARTVGPRGRVVSFEPDPANLALLRRNVDEAGLTNVTIIDRGLWSHTTELSFVADHGLSSHVQTGVAGGTRIAVVSFEEACRLAGAVPDFVKMDIEGAEVETIEGALDFIRQRRIQFSIASYHDRGGKPTSSLLEPLFAKIGYAAETGFPAHQTTWAWKK